mgnify:CR=1 FL=1
MSTDIHNVNNANNSKRVGVAISISDKIEFISKKVTKDREGNYVLIKISIKQGDITIYAPNSRSSDYAKQKLTELRGEIDSYTVTEI